MLVLAKKKKSEIMLLLYTLNLVKTPQLLAGKRQNHFPYVHKETLRVLNSLSDKYKNSNDNQPTRGRHPR